MKKRLAAFATVLALLLPLVPAEAAAAGRYGQHGFTEVKTQGTGEGTYHLLRHTDTGAQVVWLENGSETREFAIGFRTRRRTARARTMFWSIPCSTEASNILSMT